MLLNRLLSRLPRIDKLVRIELVTQAKKSICTLRKITPIEALKT